MSLLHLFLPCVMACLASSDEGPARDSHYLLDFGAGGLAEPKRGDILPRGSHWNVVQYTPSLGWNLADHEGWQTGVELRLTGAASWAQCNVFGPASDLLSGGVHGVGENLTVELSGLPSGTYALVLYARPHCQADATDVYVGRGVPREVCLQIDPHGNRPEASVFLVSSKDGTIACSLRPSSAFSHARLAGLACLHLSEDMGKDAAAFMQVPGMVWAVGAQTRGTEIEAWSRTVPDHAGSFASGWLGFPHERSTPFPGPAPAWRSCLSGSGKSLANSSGSAPHMSMHQSIHLVGTSIWAQAAGRDRSPDFELSPVRRVRL